MVTARNMSSITVVEWEVLNLST